MLFYSYSSIINFIWSWVPEMNSKPHIWSKSTKHNKSKCTDFLVIDVTHPWKDCWKAIFLKNQYNHSLFNIRGGLGEWKVEFCEMPSSWRKFYFSSCTTPCGRNMLFSLPKARKRRNKQKKSLEQIGVIQTTYFPLSKEIVSLI